MFGNGISGTTLRTLGSRAGDRNWKLLEMFNRQVVQFLSLLYLQQLSEARDRLILRSHS
ncbi:MAG: hypothetical protein ACI9R3_001931 [Verrucomicrobiales bacterium]|jgi:hypothetical protein